MGFFDKLFGKKSGTPPTTTILKPPAASPAPPGAPPMMKVWDAYGRVGQIPREEWRTQVLPLNFQKNWSQPEDLANLISSALNDGFIADCLEPARQLQRIDPAPKRGAIYLAVVLLQLKKFGEAEQILTETIQRHGEDGPLLTNLAKAYSGKGDQPRAERTLWHALEVDPNLDNALLWYQAIHRERDGDAAGLEALRRVAALPASWRPQIWLARASLKAGQLEPALALYQEALDRAGKPAPASLLQQMSGDLGNAGHLPEILQLAEPHFDAATHGFDVGNNLIKAHLDLGQLAAARRILDQLYALKRTDWKENLNFWDNEIARARVAATGEPEQPMQVSMLTIEGPIWLKPASPAAELFPAKTGAPVAIAFLGGTADIPTNSTRIVHQMSDAPGRLSRGLPLFLAEQVEFAGCARTQTLIPWIAGDTPGFVLAGGPWADDVAASHARQSTLKSDYVVTVHLKADREPWIAELRLIRTIDGHCLASLNGSFTLPKPEEGIPGLARQLLQALKEHAEVDAFPTPALYEVPAAPYFSYYLLRLEQLLAVRCGGMDGLPRSFLSGEREILDGNLQLCLEFPQNTCVRILLAQTLLAMKRARPDILPEFSEKIALLQHEKPLPEPAQGVLQRMVNEAFRQ